VIVFKGKGEVLCLIQRYRMYDREEGDWTQLSFVAG